MKLIAMFFALAGVSAAQILNTEPIGKGKSTVFISGAALAAKDYTVLASSSVQLIRGANDRVDLYFGAGPVTALGQVQWTGLAGANVRLIKVKGVSLMTFNLLLVPLHRRRDSCDAMAYASLYGVKTFKRFGLYGGWAATVPLGQKADKLFTPPETLHTFPAGIAIPRGHWTFFAEYDFGRKQKVGAIGIAYTF